MPVPPKPRAILGLMTYGPPSHADNRITTLDDFRQHLEVFCNEYGHNEIDTARIYAGGKQEGFTRQAEWETLGLSVATKSYPLTPGGHKAANLRKDLETSLSELGTACVDIFYLHAADRSVPFTETLMAADSLYQEGKFKTLGLSNFSAYEIAEIVMLCEARGWVKPTIYQGLYNALTRNLETEIIPACRRFGLDVVVYNTLCGGLLTGRYGNSPAKESTDGRFNPATFLGPIYRSMYFNEAMFQAVGTVREAADAHGLTMTEVALRWCIHHSALKTASNGGRDGVVIGVSKLEHLRQGLLDLNKGPLPEDVVHTLEEAWRTVGGTSPNTWHTPLVYTYERYS